MSTRLRLVLAAIAAAQSAMAAQSVLAPDTLPDVIARIRPAIGAVGTYSRTSHPPVQFSASGFFIDRRGYFVTANHVVENIGNRGRLDDLAVFLPTDKDRTGHPAAVVTRAPKYDLALLKVKGDGFATLKVNINKSTKVRAGQAVALIGYPFGFLLGRHPSTSYGIVSARSPIAIPAINTAFLDADTRAALRSPFDIFQLDATAYPGHSGGPLFDPRTGEVLGVMNSAFIRRTKERVVSSGISYAIPIHFAAELLDDALNAKQPGENAKKHKSPAKP